MKTWKEYFNLEYQPSNEASEIISQRVNFLISELNISSGDTILSIGCGDGKYICEFAKRGFRVTGIDYSNTMLKLAKNRAKSCGVKVELIEAYAQDYVSEKKYDAIISLHQGAFCLLEDNDSSWAKDMAILANMAAMMSVGKKFAISFLNAFYLVNKNSLKNLDMFLLTGKNKNGLRERYYTPTEVVRMVNRIGLKADDIYSLTSKDWNPAPPSFDTEEFIVIGHRKDHKGKSQTSK